MVGGRIPPSAPFAESRSLQTAEPTVTYMARSTRDLCEEIAAAEGHLGDGVDCEGVAVQGDGAALGIDIDGWHIRVAHERCPSDRAGSVDCRESPATPE